MTGPVVVTSGLLIALFVVCGSLIVLGRLGRRLVRSDDGLGSPAPAMRAARARWNEVTSQAGEVRQRLAASGTNPAERGTDDDGS